MVKFNFNLRYKRIVCRGNYAWLSRKTLKQKKIVKTDKQKYGQSITEYCRCSLVMWILTKNQTSANTWWKARKFKSNKRPDNVIHKIDDQWSRESSREISQQSPLNILIGRRKFTNFEKFYH